MKKILYASLMALVLFAVFNFFYSNMGGEAFNHPLSFSFNVPYIFNLRSFPIPVGFLLISSFCLGMVFLPLLQLIPALFRSLQIRERDKKIRELEKELEEFRGGSEIMPGSGSDASS